MKEISKGNIFILRDIINRGKALAENEKQPAEIKDKIARGYQTIKK